MMLNSDWDLLCSCGPRELVETSEGLFAKVVIDHRPDCKECDLDSKECNFRDIFPCSETMVWDRGNHEYFNGNVVLCRVKFKINRRQTVDAARAAALYEVVRNASIGQHLEHNGRHGTVTYHPHILCDECIYRRSSKRRPCDAMDFTKPPQLQVPCSKARDGSLPIAVLWDKEEPK